MAFKLDNIPGMESILPGQQGQNGQPQVFSNPIANSVVTHAADPNSAGATASPSGGGSTPPPPAENPSQPQKPKRSYVQIIQDLMPEWDPEKMKADIEADKKRQKRQAIFAAIGDGVTALSNLFFTTKGAPNMYDASKGMAATHTAYWDKVKAERDKNRQQYLNAYLTAAGMDDAADERSWTREHTIEREKIADQHYADEMQYRKDRDNIADQRWTQQWDFSQQQWEEQNRQWDLQFEELKRHNEASEATARISAANSGSSTPKYQVLSFGNKLLQIPTTHFNPANLGRVWATIPETERQRFQTFDQNTGKWNPPTAEQMCMAIGASSGNSAVQAELQRIGGTVRDQDNVMP